MKVTLPSGRTIIIAAGKATGKPVHDAPSGIFASEHIAFLSGSITLREPNGNHAIAVSSLPLCDFNALRAIAARLGLLEEAPVTFDCHNCDQAIVHGPSASLALGPFEDGELHDPELDRTIPFDVAHAVPTLGDVILSPRTLAEAAPLHEALDEPTFRITPAVVAAMGIASIDGEADPKRLAKILTRASDQAWAGVTDLFLNAHYSPRLFSIAVCPHCGARNDVDAPYEREFEPSGDVAKESRITHRSNEESFPSFEEFDRATNEIAAPFLEDPSAAGVVLVIEGGVPACDDGGDPLLGSFVPGYEGDMGSPSRGPEITVFYRSFRAMWNDEGRYDWRAEIAETIAHELDHHRAELEGDDPVDDEERAEIAREQERIVGKKALARGEVRALIGDIRTFLIRTWPIWILLLLATLVAAYSDVR